jgi:hypothetical protein
MAADTVKPNKPQAELLGKLYLEAATPSDRLPYSDAFERLYAVYAEATHMPPDAYDGRRQVWRMLCGLRKSGDLPRLDLPRKNTVLECTGDQEQALRRLYAGTGLPVDRLPYTAQFERLYAELCRAGLNQMTGWGFSPDRLNGRSERQWVWLRLVALRKSGKLGRKTGRKVK